MPRARRPRAPARPAEVRIAERGDVFFFYRPRVERDAPRGERDVQRFLVVLAPDGGDRFRLVAIGRKHMPLPGPAPRGSGAPGTGPGATRLGRERNWAWVMKVAGAAAELEIDLRGYAYDTRTRGHRHQPAARPAGAGRYALARHGGHAHLAYALARPASPGPVQRELGIEASASLVVAVKNPHWPTPPGVDAGLSPDAEAFYPEPLQLAFRGRRWAALEPGHLDREGAEVVLVGTREAPDEELGIDLSGEEPEDVLELFGLDPAQHPVAPLLTGDWA